MPLHTEPSANNALALILEGMMHGCKIHAESTQAIAGHSGLQPDILITAADRAPVVIEAEFMPAYTVEQEAAGRLQLEVAGGGNEIEAVIALRYPAGLKEANSLDAELRNAQLSYCILTAPEEDDAEYDRFPESGWLQGSVADVAELARLVSVPQRTVNAAASILEEGIDRAVGVLNAMEQQAPATLHEIAGLLGMSEVPQTRRMACAIIANAMVFHDRIAILHQEIKKLNLLWKADTDNPQGKISDAWLAILKINYWPIFAVARDIVDRLPSHEAAQMLNELRDTAQSINSTGANIAHDLTGRVFQRLIVDRKYLATFYTLPASAALLARLAVEKLRDVDWSDADAIGRLRVGDFACGTGALLSAVYEQIATRHGQTGGSPAALHKAMMEDVLYGCDVMPSAIHITSSTLSGREPTVGFGRSRLYNMPYGRQSDGTVAIGSLELLQSSSVLTLFNTSDPAMRTGSAGEETAAQVMADIQDESFDIVIMNPPFTRAGSDWEGIDREEDSIKQFKGLGTSLDTQRAMSQKLKVCSQRTSYHGYAGLASAFAALAHRKLKQGGILALVLPLTAAVGLSWDKFRQMMAEHYADLEVLSIAANGNDMSFSSDTGMAECLVVARRLREGEFSSDTAIFTSFNHRPQGFAHSAAIASEIAKNTSVRSIDDGPYGGTPLMVGEEPIGEMLTSTYDTEGETWAAVRLSDASLAQTAYGLSKSRLWLPSIALALDLKLVPLNLIGRRGIYDMNIAGTSSSAPFTKTSPSSSATYPALWNHNASRETRIVCQPDAQLQVKISKEQRAAVVWSTASRVHLSRGFRFNSQPLAVAFTDQKSIGGRAWPNVILPDVRYDYASVIWGNSTLGLLSYWWHANRQVAGRGDITVTSAETLPVLDFCALTDEQLATAKAIFNDFRTLDLKPAYLADADPNRAVLDRRVLCDLLGFDEDIYKAVRLLAAKWCAEPSVHGGKRRPRSAELVF